MNGIASGLHSSSVRGSMYVNTGFIAAGQEGEAQGWPGGAVHNTTAMLRTLDQKRRPSRPDRRLVERVTVMVEGLLQAGEVWLWTEKEPYVATLSEVTSSFHEL